MDFLRVALLLAIVAALAPLWPWVPPTSPSFPVNTAPTAFYEHPPGFRLGLVAMPPSRAAKPAGHGRSYGSRPWENRRTSLPRASAAFSGEGLKSAGAWRPAHPGDGALALTLRLLTRTRNSVPWSPGLRPHSFSNPLRASWLAACPPAGLLRQRPPRPLRREELLRSPIRAAIVREVQRTPGIHYRELARVLGLSNGSLEYHLHLMERANILRPVRTNGRTLCFDAEAPPRPQELIPPGLERDILDRIRGGKLDSIGTIALQLGLSYGQASYHVRQLRDLGLVDARRGNEGLVLAVQREA